MKKATCKFEWEVKVIDNNGTTWFTYNDMIDMLHKVRECNDNGFELTIIEREINVKEFDITESTLSLF